MASTLNKLEIFVVCAPGLEAVTGAEMLRLGIHPEIVEPGGLSCSGSMQDVMRLNLWLRTASRVLVRIASFHASTFHELERRAKKIEWNRFLNDRSTVAFRVTCRKSRLYHSDAVAERLSRSLVSQLKGVKLHGGDFGEPQDLMAGLQQFVVRLSHDEVTVSLDSSGDLLHRRGYRLVTAKAPIRETIAAAMLLAAEWTGEKSLLDPLCGSGTLAIEAALIARSLAPGRSRHFAFIDWRGFEGRGWKLLLADADRKSKTKVSVSIAASDRDEGAVKAAVENAGRAGVAADIDVTCKSMTQAIAAAGEMGNGFLVTNPPYGKRVGEGADPQNLYASLGKSARACLSGWCLIVVTNEDRLVSQLRLPVERLFSTSNGGIPVQAVKGVIP